MAEPEIPEDWAGALWVLVAMCRRNGAVSTNTMARSLGTRSARTMLRGLERRGYARAFAPDPHGPLHWEPTFAGRDYVDRNGPPPR